MRSNFEILSGAVGILSAVEMSQHAPDDLHDAMAAPLAASVVRRMLEELIERESSAVK